MYEIYLGYLIFHILIGFSILGYIELKYKKELKKVKINVLLDKYFLILLCPYVVFYDFSKWVD